MSKKRKTRQQKIILQLKRKLAAQERKKALLEPNTKLRQEATSSKSLLQSQGVSLAKRRENIVLSYNPMLVKKDILKTLILTSAIIGLQIVLYLKLS